MPDVECFVKRGDEKQEDDGAKREGQEGWKQS